MNTPSFRTLRLAQALLLTAATLTGASALAASNTDPADAQARYQQERAVCNSGKSNQDRSTCLREAGAALAEARHGGLGDGSASYTGNKLIRCEHLTGDDQLACVARMQGLGTTSGTAADGGIYRELVTRETELPAKIPPAKPMQKPMPMPMPMQQPMPQTK